MVSFWGTKVRPSVMKGFLKIQKSGGVNDVAQEN